MGVVLVVNAGSASLKLSVVRTDASSEKVESLAAAPARVDAVAHRVVHGGTRFREPVVIDDEVERELRELIELAPLHNRPAVERIAEARAAFGDVPHVAVFDTAFHATLPPEAMTYALPRRWREEWGIRRYGFHGLSIESAAERIRVPKLVVCHLGGGCSITAVRDGRSVETSMGFSPLEGVPMATRSGSIDAEIVLHLLRTGKLDAEAIENALGRESGLLGISNVSSHVEELERLRTTDAELALQVFAYRVAGAVAASVVALEGIDALAFTGGVGEGSARIRADVCARLRLLGIEIDAAANESARPDASIANADSPVHVVVLKAREDVVAARAARGLLGLPQALIAPFFELRAGEGRTG